jgi:pimeloyl-ACP methyl ester carboxylesterase
MAIKKFKIPYSQEAIDDLESRLNQTRWPEDGGFSPWEGGTDASFLKDICHYWATGFNWRDTVERLEQQLQHFRFTSGGYTIHFVYQRGRGPNPMPLIMTHGWPGSFLEMESIIPLLTDPKAHGGSSNESFDVIVPSLPGFGYSGVPTEPATNVQRVAELWAKLMYELGYERFAVQGGDIGAGVATAIGLRYPERLIGIHLNYLPGSYEPHLPDGSALTKEENNFLNQLEEWDEREGAYAHMQGTRPLTASYGLADSPVGMAAWILEKYRAWSDCGGDIYNRFSRDDLLANLMLYWTTNTIGTSFRMYYEGRRTPLQFGPRDFVQVPTAFAEFPAEISHPPRTWVERGYDIRRWTMMPRGGHFAAAEEPELLAHDLRQFFRYGP